MESEDIVETNGWHVSSQKDRDRERRRVRDRQRRQSMSQEERERHLARRRRNYQLRRQRASMVNSTCSGFEMDMITNENLEPVPVTEVGFQFNVSNGYGAMYATHNAPDMKSEGYVGNGTEELSQKLAINSEGLRLHQIKHLARELNKSSGKLDDNSFQCLTDTVTNGTSEVKCESIKCTRLVHVKRLARALHSTARLELDGSSRVEEAEISPS
ncbi:hypothetical protein Leryth_017631 [Lithospermum erythrorhizon]|nr:hypothetical protein Leryth_017631 [Lithospermum erythrorhizon]